MSNENEAHMNGARWNELAKVPTSEGGLQPTRCKATSKQTGKQCGRYVAQGFTVCK